MDYNELELLEEFAVGNLSEEEFFSKHPVDIKNNRSYLLDQIDKSTEERDGERLDLLLDVIVNLEMYEDYDFQAKYRELIKEDWHRMHESLVDSLDKNIQNEDSFIQVLNSIYPYYADGIEDFMVPIWSKCLWCLYAIRSDRAISEISKYQSSKYEYLRDTSIRLLAKLNDEQA